MFGWWSPWLPPPISVLLRNAQPGAAAPLSGQVYGLSRLLRQGRETSG